MKIILWIGMVLGCLLSCGSANAQQSGKTKIELVRADYQDFNTEVHPDAQRLTGNVVMRHEGVLMYCDSAYLYDKSNQMEAFSNVRINQGDTLHLYGDMLRYQAATKTAEVFNNIRLTDKEMVLTTDYLIHNLATDVSTYLEGGKIVSTENSNVLTSERGDYYSETKFFFFRNNVVLVNEDFTITTDSLRFDINTEIAYFIGPTEIESDDSFIYCENGWSDTRKNISQFNKNAYIITDTQRMEGDSLYHNQAVGYGEAFNNVQITDTVNNYMINGNYAIHYDSTGQSMVTERAVLTLIEGLDSLFLHGDTLFSKTDSLDNHVVNAYYGVRFFRNDLQGKCDSLVYSQTDSIIQMYHQPIIWSEENQISGRFITLFLGEDGLEKMYIDQDSFIASQADSLQFNQIKGAELTGYFGDGNLQKVKVRGNSETIYYAKEEVKDGPDKDIGMNRLICSDIDIYLDSNAVKKIVFIDQPDGVLLPIDQLKPGDETLDNFKWSPEERPLRRSDIFLDLKAAPLPDPNASVAP